MKPTIFLPLHPTDHDLASTESNFRVWSVSINVGQSYIQPWFSHPRSRINQAISERNLGQKLRVFCTDKDCHIWSNLSPVDSNIFTLEGHVLELCGINFIAYTVFLVKVLRTELLKFLERTCLTETQKLGKNETA